MDESNYRKRLVAFYQAHNQAKINEVDSTLEKYRGREEELFKKLEAKYASYLPAQGKGPEYFLHTVHGRILCRVFADVAPMAAANFGSMCTGAPVPPANRSTINSYKGTRWHRIVPELLIQGGDTTRGDGRGGRSAFDLPLANDMWGHFDDERPFLAHDRAGLLSMANTGPNSNSSQFFITLKAMPHLNGGHVVFGEIVDGMETVRTINRLPTDKDQRPYQETQITDCGPCPEIEEVVKEIAAAPISKPSPVPFTNAASTGSSPFASTMDKASPFTSSAVKPSPFASSAVERSPFGPVGEPDQLGFGSTAPTSASKHSSFFSPIPSPVVNGFLLPKTAEQVVSEAKRAKKISTLSFSTLYGTDGTSSNSNFTGAPSPIPSAHGTAPPVAAGSAFSLASSAPTSPPALGVGKAPESSQVSSIATHSSTPFGDKKTMPTQSSLGLPFVANSYDSISDMHSFSEDGRSTQDATVERNGEDGSNEHRIAVEAERPAAAVVRSRNDSSGIKSDRLSFSEQNSPFDAVLPREDADGHAEHLNTPEAEIPSIEGVPTFKDSSSVMSMELGDVLVRSVSPPGEPPPFDISEKVFAEQSPVAAHLSGSPTKPSEPQAMQLMEARSHVTSDRSVDLPTKSFAGLRADSAILITQATESSTPTPPDQSSDQRGTSAQAAYARSIRPPTEALTKYAPSESGENEPTVESPEMIVNDRQRLLESSSNEWIMTRYGVWTKREDTVSDAGDVPEPDPGRCILHSFDPLALRLHVVAGAILDIHSQSAGASMMRWLPDRLPARSGAGLSNQSRMHSLGTTLDQGAGAFEVDCRKSEILVYGRQVEVGDDLPNVGDIMGEGSETCESSDPLIVDARVDLTRSRIANGSGFPAMSRSVKLADSKSLSAAEPIIPATIVQDTTSRADSNDTKASGGSAREQLPTESAQHPRLVQSRTGNNFLSQPHAILQIATTPIFTFGSAPAFAFGASRPTESWSPEGVNADSTHTPSVNPFTQALSDGPIKGYNPFAPGPKFKFGPNGGEDRSQVGLVSFTSLDSISVTSDVVGAKEDLYGEASD
jgi:cyclophilin family peptidyl-prolyl cis-trans isomerase